MWLRKPGFDGCPGAGSARSGRAYLVVARLHAVAVPGARSHTAECVLPVVMLAAVAAIKLLAGHGMIAVATLHVLSTETRLGWDAGVGACGSLAKLPTTNTVCVRKTELGGHWECVEVSPFMAAAETVHAGTVPGVLS